MRRLREWLMIAMTTLGGELQWRADRLGHLNTDPLCKEYEAPRIGSRLDKASRGLICGECMSRRAFAPKDALLAWTTDHNEQEQPNG